MQRLNPLLKMFLRMFCYSAAVFTIAHALINLIFLSQRWGIIAGDALYILLGVAKWSVAPALALALPLTLATALFFRDIRRPGYYRFAMLSVALLATITVWPHSYVEFGYMLRHGGAIAAFGLANIAGNALAIYMSVIVAGKYLRDLSELQQK